MQAYTGRLHDRRTWSKFIARRACALATRKIKQPETWGNTSILGISEDKPRQALKNILVIFFNSWQLNHRVLSSNVLTDWQQRLQL